MRGFLLLPALVLFSCSEARQGEGPVLQGRSYTQQHHTARTVGEIPLPDGYKRIPAADGGYTAFLRSIRLKKDPTVYLCNGARKSNQQAQYAVLDLDVGDKDLQQCADAVMRIRAEFLYQREKYDEISFRFTNGFICDFKHYAEGYRALLTGAGGSWQKKAAADYSRKNFRSYLDFVYSYAGTRSLHAQLKPVTLHAIRPGQVFIQTGSPYGHAVTVMDMAYHPQTGDTLFLLSQSYMPAQDIHILRNPTNSSQSPWYSTGFKGDLKTPEWIFSREDLKTF